MGQGTGGKGAPAPPGFSGTAQQGIQAGVDNAANRIGMQGALPTGADARKQAFDAAYGQASSRLDPQWSARGSNLTSQLANQGLDPGSAAYSRAMDQFGRDRNDAYTSAANAAIGQSTEAGNQIFQQGVTSQMLPYQQLSALQGLRSSDYGNQLQNYGIGQAGKNSLLSGIGQLGSMAAIP